MLGKLAGQLVADSAVGADAGVGLEWNGDRKVGWGPQMIDYSMDPSGIAEHYYYYYDREETSDISGWREKMTVQNPDDQRHTLRSRNPAIVDRTLSSEW
jgi:hypothetical protein